jgi:predicted dehydrogenase
MPQQTRRQLLRGAAAVSFDRVLGAADRISLAIVGLGGRGMDHLNNYLELPDAHIEAVVDVNQVAQERAQALVRKAKGYTPKAHYDMREAFQDKGIDAVSIATPNHWHVLASIWAIQAGKDVYVEKPVSHNIWEGRQLLAAARKHNKIVQVGQQSRSIAHKQKAMKLLREGVIGEIYMAKGLCYKRRKSIGHKPDEPIPAGLNWDMFLGPAPMRPYNELRFRYNWHWFWDTGNGDIGNQGVHEMDICLWGLGKKTLPKSVVSTGGKFVYKDDQETPNTQVAIYDHDGAQMVFEVRGLITGDESGVRLRGNNTIGNVFCGSEGYMAIDSHGFQVYLGEDHKLAMDEKPAEKIWDTSGHMANFLAAVRSRRRENLNCDIETGMIAAAHCHLANISYRTGRKLTVDPANFSFLNDAAANQMLTRQYRDPYKIPEVL